MYDNVNLAPSDFDLVTLTAPTNAKLPDGGGFPATYLHSENRREYDEYAERLHFCERLRRLDESLAGRRRDRASRALANGLVLQAGIEHWPRRDGQLRAVVAEVPRC